MSHIHILCHFKSCSQPRRPVPKAPPAGPNRGPKHEVDSRESTYPCFSGFHAGLMLGERRLFQREREVECHRQASLCESFVRRKSHQEQGAQGTLLRLNAPNGKPRCHTNDGPMQPTAFSFMRYCGGPGNAPNRRHCWKNVTPCPFMSSTFCDLPMPQPSNSNLAVSFTLSAVSALAVSSLCVAVECGWRPSSADSWHSLQLLIMAAPQPTYGELLDRLREQEVTIQGLVQAGWPVLGARSC